MELTKKLDLIKLIKITSLILLGSLLLTLSAKIKIPFYPVPMTMQTFVVLFMGVAFGWRIAVATITLYLFEGAIGLPVFAGTPEKGLGLSYIIGPTFGYLIGFLVSAFLAGYLNFKTNLLNVFVKLIFCVSIIYILGMFWLGILIGWDKPIFELGAKPFLLAELFKLLILTLIAKKIIFFKNFI